MIKLTTRIGKQTFQIDLPTMRDVHKFNKTYGSLPSKCDACGSENVFISYMNPGGNDYFTIECGACGANANFGIHKEGQGLFWKGDKMAVWVAPEQQAGNHMEQPNRQPAPGQQTGGPYNQDAHPGMQPQAPVDDLPF